MKITFLALSASTKMVLMLLCFMLPTVGCKKLLTEIKLTREQMTVAIDDAVTTIQNAPASWQTTLSDLEEEFSEDINTNMATRVSVLKNEVVGQVETGIICLMDAAANRAVFGLRRLKAELLGEELPLPIPYLCSTSHYTVDLNTAVVIRRNIEFYGYDFVQREKMSAYLVNNNGTETYMNNAIHFLTNYQFVLDLAPYNDNYLKLYNYISIRFEGEEISNIAIQQDNVPPPTRTLSIVPSRFGYIPPLRQGDNWIGDSGSAVSLYTNVRTTHKQVYLKIHMYVREQGGDRTTAFGWSDNHTFYTAPDGWHIKRVESPSMFSILQGWKASDHEQNLDLELGQWTLYGCNGDDRIGEDTRVSANFTTPFTIIIEKDN